MQNEQWKASQNVVTGMKSSKKKSEADQRKTRYQTSKAGVMAV